MQQLKFVVSCMQKNILYEPEIEVIGKQEVINK